MGRRRKSKSAIDRELGDLPADQRRHQFMKNLVAVLFAAAQPVNREELASVIGGACNLDQLLSLAGEALRGLPFEIVKIAGGFQMRTRLEYGPVIRASGVTTRGSPRLSERQLQALATIAYNQPITRREVSEKIGAESDVAVSVLRDAGLIAHGSRRAAPGAPPTYVTTTQFKIAFGLDSLDDLPPLEEIELLRDRRAMPPELSGDLPGSDDADDEGDGRDYGPSSLRSDAASREEEGARG
jgi:segregation and condensation protein B